MKKVLIVSTLEAVPWGGSEELWHYVAKNLLMKGVHVIISRIEWNPVPVKLQELLDLGAEILYRPNIHVSRPLTDIKFRIKKQFHKLTYSKVLERLQPDSILINQSGNFDEYLERLGSFLLKSNISYYVVCHHAFEHSYLPETRRINFQKIYSVASKVIFVSQRNKEVTERELAMFIPNAQVIYHPPITIKKEVSLPYPTQDIVKFACVARLDVAYKGQDILLQTLSSEKWLSRKWHLSLYGNGPHRKYLEDLVLLYKLQDKVFFKGHIASVADLWAENHLLVLPSISEGTPLSLYEACYYGRSAVVTDVGGNKEIVIDNNTGFIAEGPNVNSLDKSLERAWQMQTDWEIMGKKAKIHIAEILKNDAFSNVVNDLIHL